MDWDKMVEIEPGLKRLYDIAKTYQAEAKKNKDFCANRIWYGRHGLKADLIRLVGYLAQNERLSSSGAYDVAYQKIYNALPDCRHGGWC